VREFVGAVTTWHRWLGASGPPGRGAGDRGGAPPATFDASVREPRQGGSGAAVVEWRRITLRLGGPPQGALSFTFEKAHRGRPDLRHQVAVDRQTGALVGVEGFVAAYDAGRKARTWLGWIRTGEAAGVPGQALAGLVSAGAAVLVWTGLASSWRRLVAWQGRRKRRVGFRVPAPSAPGRPMETHALDREGPGA